MIKYSFIVYAVLSAVCGLARRNQGSETPTVYTEQEQGTFRLKCPISLSKVVFWTWKKDGIEVGPLLWNGESEERFKLDNVGELRIRHLRRDDSGLYECAASDGYQTKSYQFKLEVVDAAVMPTGIIDRSRFEREYNITEGRPFRLACSAAGADLVRWHRGSINGYVVNDDVVLQFNNPTKLDSGQYVCATYRLGRLTDNWAVSINVVEFSSNRPEVYIPLTTNLGLIVRSVNSTVILPCVVRSYGPVVVQWLRYERQEGDLGTASERPRGRVRGSGSFLVLSQHEAHLSAQSNFVDHPLVIRSAQLNDSAVYACQARNQNGDNSVVVHLDVMATNNAPVESINVPLLILKSGDSLRLRCGGSDRYNAESVSMGSVIWFKDNSLLPKENRAELHIEAVQSTNSGIYRCVAQQSTSDAAGSLNKLYDVVVLPDHPASADESGLSVRITPTEPVVHSGRRSQMLVCNVSSRDGPPRIWWVRLLPNRSSALSPSASRLLYLNDHTYQVLGRQVAERGAWAYASALNVSEVETPAGLTTFVSTSNQLDGTITEPFYTGFYTCLTLAPNGLLAEQSVRLSATPADVAMDNPAVVIVPEPSTPRPSAVVGSNAEQTASLVVIVLVPSMIGMLLAMLLAYCWQSRRKRSHFGRGSAQNGVPLLGYKVPQTVLLAGGKGCGGNASSDGTVDVGSMNGWLAQPRAAGSCALQNGAPKAAPAIHMAHRFYMPPTLAAPSSTSHDTAGAERRQLCFPYCHDRGQDLSLDAALLGASVRSFPPASGSSSPST